MEIQQSFEFFLVKVNKKHFEEATILLRLDNLQEFITCASCTYITINICAKSLDIFEKVSIMETSTERKDECYEKHT